jgi:uncharacterized protein (DUF2141 family)
MRLVFIVLLSVVTYCNAQSQTLRIEIDNFRNSEGQVLLNYYPQERWLEDGFIENQRFFPKKDLAFPTMCVFV